MEPSDEANKGFNVTPTRGCIMCGGRGFYYLGKWAKTCICKKRHEKTTTK